MRKIIVVLVLFCLTSKTYSQFYIVKTGLNFSNMIIKDESKTYSSNFDVNRSIHAGFLYDFDISENFFIETGLNFSTKGYKHSVSAQTEFVDLYYLVIPYNGKINFSKRKTKFYGLLGPYMGIGLKGKDKIENTISGKTVPVENNIKFGSDDKSNLNRIDLGLTAGVSIEIKSFMLGLTYELGLINIAHYQELGSKMVIRNKVVGLSIGYILNKKNK